MLLRRLRLAGRRRGSGSNWRGSSSSPAGTCPCPGVEGDQEPRTIFFQSPGFCKQCCSASVGIPKAWRGDSYCESHLWSSYDSQVGGEGTRAGGVEFENWRLTACYQWLIPPFVQHKGIYRGGDRVKVLC